MQPAEFNLPPPLGELAVTTTTLSSATYHAPVTLFKLYTRAYLWETPS